MKNRTAYLPGFSHHLSGRAKQENARRLRVQSNALDGLAALVERFVPATIFEQAMGRERVFTPWVTFIAFSGKCSRVEVYAGRRCGECRSGD